MMNKPAKSKSVSLWARLLLGLYPAEFRRRFGHDLAETLSERLRESRQQGLGPWLSTLMQESVECVRGAVAEHAGPMDAEGEPLRRAGASGWSGDVTYGARRLLRDPWVSLLAILTLACGLGICTAVLTLVDNVLLRPLPYPEPDRLVRVWAEKPDDGLRYLDATWDEVHALKAKGTGFSSMAAFSIAPRDLSDDTGRPQQVEIARLSPGFFDVLGVEPVQGRNFSSEEYGQGLPVVMLSHRFWQARYGGEPVVGQGLSIQGERHEIVGVMPASFDYPHGSVLWRPFNRDENQDDDRELQVVARLASGVDALAASQMAGGIYAGLAVKDSDPSSAWVQPFKQMLVRDVDGVLWALLVGVAALLLVAMANVAHLHLARSTLRRRELAVRLALGADGKRLVRQLVIESLILTSVAGVVGLVFGYGLLHAVLSTVPTDLPRLVEVSLDLRVVLLMALLTLGTGLAFGFGFALQCARRAPLDDLRSTRSGPEASTQRVQQILVIGEIALTTVLVLTATLLFASVVQRLDVEPGFQAQGLISMGVSPPPAMDEWLARQQFYEETAQELSRMPGVSSVAAASADPVQTSGFPLRFHLHGDAVDPKAPQHRAVLRSVDAQYFETVGARLLKGRFLATTDHADSPGVAVVNEAFVKTYLASGSAVGRRMVQQAFGGGEPPQYEIVGVVADMLPEAAVEPKPWIFIPYRQFPWPRMRLLVRTSLPEQALIGNLRAHLWQLHPDLALDDAWPVTTLVDRLLAQSRFQMRLMAGFSQFALVLAILGLYAVLTLQVSQSRRELGVRRALGAGAGSVIRWVLSQGLKVTIPGILLGMATTVAVARWLESRSYILVSPLAPNVWLPVCASLLLVGILVGLGPAWRAMKVDPAAELRAD